MKEIYWKILKGQSTLPDTLRAFDYPEDEIEKQMQILKSKDNFSASGLFTMSLYFANISYLKLVEMGEIDVSEIYHFNTPPYLGDIGFRGQDTFRFADGEWIDIKY
jgi:hypothetical protein